VSTYYALANLYIGKYEITAGECESGNFCSSSSRGGGGGGGSREHLNPTVLFHFSLLAKVLKLVQNRSI
jgi:hypothetical protein